MNNLADDYPLKVSDGAQKDGLGVETVLKVDEVKDVYHQVIAKGYLIYSVLTKRPWGMIDFIIFDPDGYYIRITSKDLPYFYRYLLTFG
ncbi:VOC family protein [Oceanobacillus senegalensis]|uniref:VOC family protein n=1 Tax=Oceanobacillus senegalensis TaxID=1936063 RepID=UPI000A30B132|nr:VOC family protein [Oceanobacillus senegalensis]